MENKTKNVIIIILAVLLFISVMFNVMNLRPHGMMDRGMMQRGINNRSFNNGQMPENRNDRMPNDSQNTQDNVPAQESNQIN
jgi:hypothetical protein